MYIIIYWIIYFQIYFSRVRGSYFEHPSHRKCIPTPLWYILFDIEILYIIIVGIYYYIKVQNITKYSFYTVAGAETNGQSVNVFDTNEIKMKNNNVSFII